MRDWTSPDHDSGLSVRKGLWVWACLLAVAAVGTGRQTPPQGPTQPSRRFTPPARLHVIQLPAPVTSGSLSVEQALLGLRNLQAPGNQRVDLPKISQLAWAMQGMTTAAGAAGALPVPADVAAMKVYFVLPDGLHLYNPADHTLQQVTGDDAREAMTAALLSQTGGPTGGCQVILAASAQEFGKRYGPRARTIMLLQAGRMAQSLQLETVAQGLTFVSVDAVDAAAVRRVARMLRTFEPLYVAFIGYPAGQTPPTTATTGRVGQTTALLVVPSQGFQDEELMVTKRALEQAGVPVMVASMRMGVLTGMLGGTIRTDLLLNQVNLENFGAVVLIGGVGAVDYLNNATVLNLVRQAVTQRKVLAAIGTAPSILASAGVLKSVRSTALLSEQVRLSQAGAIYTGNPVEKDALIITATGPIAGPVFARAILDGLAEVRPATTP